MVNGYRHPTTVAELIEQQAQTILREGRRLQELHRQIARDVNRRIREDTDT